MNAPDPLAALRDIRPPPAPSWWPPAPGWWLFAVLAAAALSVIGLRALRRRRFRRPAREARRILADIESTLTAGGDQAHAVRRASVLLRRYLLARFGENDIGGLRGEPLVRFLVDRCPSLARRERDLAYVLEIPYRPDTDQAFSYLTVVRAVVEETSTAPGRSSLLPSRGQRR